MKTVRCLFVLIPVGVLILLLCTAAAAAPGTGGAEKAAEAGRQYVQCLEEHPEYLSGVLFDLNGDSVDELLVSEEERFPVRAVLYALSMDGKRLLSWKVFSRNSEFGFDAGAGTLSVSSSGSGVQETCVMSLAGNDLLARRIGKNALWPEEGTHYYDFSELIPASEEVTVRFSFGLITTPDHFTIPDRDILSGHATSEEEYQDSRAYFSAVDLLAFEDRDSLVRRLDRNDG